MKKKKLNLLCVLLSIVMLVTLIPTLSVSASTLTTKSGQLINSNGRDQIKGTEDGYSYELWNQNDTGTAKMVLGSGGAFSCEWNDIENVLFRRGVDFDCTKDYKEIGNIEVEYEADYNIPNNENSYLCVYGWTKNPLIEYYIVDSWGSWRPPGGEGYKEGYKGTITVDGGEYDVYMVDHDGPSIEQGVTHFTQCWSVRKQKRSSGTISVSQHFAEWEGLGMETGKLYEAALNVEGYMSNGKANVKKNVITVGGEIKEPEPIKPIEPDENGYYFHSTFEEGSDNWESRGSAKAVVTSGAAYAGSKSMSVTGRTDAWNGTSRVLETAAFEPGKSYSFSAFVMQNKIASEDFKLSLQYSKDGEDFWSTIAKAEGAKGEWTQLANTSYTIPSGASNVIIYVETAENLTDFYVDEVIGAVEGTAVEGPVINPPPLLLGDVNLDNKRDLDDIDELQKFIVKKVSDLNGRDLADMNGDGIVNVLDLLLLKKEVLGGNGSQSADNGVDISWIDPNKPMVAISFDDGAVGTSADSSSMRILNALSESGFHSTFFYVGNWINSADKESEVKKAYDMGMEIANHTVSHPNLTEKRADEIRSEYDLCAQKLKGIIGAEPSPLLRLPYLASNSTVTSALSDVPLITCAIDTGDWNNATKDEIVNKIKAAMADGSLNNSIVLAHETYSTTAAAMEELCPYLKSQGWQIVTVSEMFAVNGKKLNGGQIYTKCN